MAFFSRNNLPVLPEERVVKDLGDLAPDVALGPGGMSHARWRCRNTAYGSSPLLHHCSLCCFRVIGCGWGLFAAPAHEQPPVMQRYEVLALQAKIGAKIQHEATIKWDHATKSVIFYSMRKHYFAGRRQKRSEAPHLRPATRPALILRSSACGVPIRLLEGVIILT